MWVIFGTGACTRESRACFEPDFFAELPEVALRIGLLFFLR